MLLYSKIVLSFCTKNLVVCWEFFSLWAKNMYGYSVKLLHFFGYLIDFFCTNSNCALEIITIARFILFISVSIERKSSYGIINTCTCMIEFKFVIKNIHVNKRLINKQLACCAWK